MTTIKIRSAIEQLQYQYPDLYNEIYMLGFNDGKKCKSSKTNDRFYMICKSLDAVQAVTNDLHADGYKSINDYFCVNYLEGREVDFYVVYNTTTKEFAVDTELIEHIENLYDAEYALYIKI
jgi:hypothetical protein